MLLQNIFRWKSSRVSLQYKTKKDILSLHPLRGHQYSSFCGLSDAHVPYYSLNTCAPVVQDVVVRRIRTG